MHFFKGFTLSLHMKRGKFCWFFITTDEEKFCSVMDILQVNPCRDYLLSLEKVTGAEISPTLPYRVTTWLEKVNISRLHNIEFYVQPSNYVNSSHFIKRNIIRWSNVSQHPKVIAFLQEKKKNFCNIQDNVLYHFQLDQFYFKVLYILICIRNIGNYFFF